MRAIAAATGVKKSSVHRHQQGIERRNQHPESDCGKQREDISGCFDWFTASVYCFGIKQGVGADETFFGLPVLVLIALASGFIFIETECENRTYDTWLKQLEQWWDEYGWTPALMPRPTHLS